MFSGQAFNETLSAFLTANKEGFHLADVSAAPLAQRRRGRGGTGGDEAKSPASPASASRSDSASSGGGADKASRKRKLYPLQEEASSQEDVPRKSTSGATRPTTLPESLADKASPESDDGEELPPVSAKNSFSQFRVAPGSRRETHEPSTDQPPPPPTSDQ